MECVSSSENVSNKKKRITEDKTHSVMLDFDVLDCPICVEPLSVPIFQCGNGHLACSSCCPKLNNKCPSCSLPIGNIRNRAMENVLESLFIPCRNAKFGCNKKATYGKESTHEKECVFSQCSCPIQDCNHTCSYNHLCRHFQCIHRRKHSCKTYNFSYGSFFNIRMNVVVTTEMIFGFSENRRMFVAQCFKESYGVYVTVSCIAPSSQEVGEFSCLLSYTTFDGHVVIYQIPKVKRVLQVCFEVPQENVMLIPRNLLRGESLEMKVCIKKL